VTAALLSVGAALVVLATALVVPRLRSPRRADFARALEAHMASPPAVARRELLESLERAAGEARRNRLLLEISSSLDLEGVLGKTVQAVATALGAEGASVAASLPGEESLVVSSGLQPAANGSTPPVGSPEGRYPRAVVLRFHYGENGGSPDPALVRSALTVALRTERGPLGQLSAYSSSPETFGEDALEELEELALGVSPAIANALRLRGVERAAAPEELPGLPDDRSALEDLLDRAVEVAERRGEPLSLLLLEVVTGEAALRELKERVGELAGSRAQLHVGTRNIAAVLPGTTLDQLAHLTHRIPLEKIRWSAGIAELRAREDARSLLRRAEDVLELSRAAAETNGA